MITKTSKIKQKSECAVVIIESSGTVRQMIVETLREQGFAKITSVSSPKDCLHAMEVDPVDWIITSLFAGESVNALHILKTITLHSNLRRVRLTLLWEESNDDEVLPYAFELGLMSLHQKSYVRDSFSELFTQLFAQLELHDWDSTLVAADHLRQHLAHKQLHKDRLALEENLLTLYPGSSLILLHLADAELANDRREEGAAILDQLELIDEKMAQNCRSLRLKYSLSPETSTAPKKNIFGIRNAIIVDPDTDVLFHAKDLLVKAGAQGVDTFESGTTACEWITTSGREPSLIIMEWKITGISGAMLVQRVRALGFHNVPIIVFSSLIKASDIHILREMGVDECQEKPFDQSSFYKAVIRVIQQSKNPTEEKTCQLKIKRLLRSGKINEAEGMIRQLEYDTRISDFTRKEIQAELHMAKGELEAARDAGIQAIKLGGDSLNMLNLIGKAMLKLRQFEYALKCFERANTISSLNVERLLNIAEACVEIDKIPEAMQAMTQAKALDVNNLDVKQMECKVNIIAGKPEVAMNLMGDAESGKNIISYMNNRAVALVKSGKFDEGIELYDRTLRSIPPTWKDQQSAVLYNTGLAYARHGDLDKAAAKLEFINKSNSIASIYKRATSLLERVKNSSKNNTGLVFTNTDAGSDIIVFTDSDTEIVTSESSADPFETPVKEPELQRGEIGCHLIYIPSIKAACKLLENQPTFRERKALDSRR